MRVLGFKVWHLASAAAVLAAVYAVVATATSQRLGVTLGLWGVTAFWVAVALWCRREERRL